MRHALNSMWCGTVAEQSIKMPYAAISVGVPDSILRQSAMVQSDYPNLSFPPACACT